jgi:hypothetical protein
MGVGSIACVALALAAALLAGPGRAADKPAADGARTIVKAAPGEKVPVVEWDFREERNPKKAGWPTGQGNNNTFTIEGDFEFHLRLQDGKDVVERVRQVNGRKEYELVKNVELTTAPQTTDAAYTEAKRLLESLGFDKTSIDSLEAWHKKAAGGNFDNLDLKTENSYNRVFTVHLINDGTSDQPWSVGLDIDWSKVCGCHG